MDGVSQCYAEDIDTLPVGMQQMWWNEFFFLDGSVVLHDAETNVDNILGVSEYSRVGFLFGFGRNMC